MSRFAGLCAALVVLTSGCATVEIPNIKAFVELPASQTGFGVETVTGIEHTIPRAEWMEKKKRAIYIFSEDWKVLKKVVRKNCINNKCKQAIGALDGLFLAIDFGLKRAEDK